MGSVKAGGMQSGLEWILGEVAISGDDWGEFLNVRRRIAEG